MSDDHDSAPEAAKPQTTYSMGGSMTASAGTSATMGAPVDYAPAQHVATAPPSDEVIIDVTTQSFMTDVMEASRIAPVIVDFWAPWCGPCKQLGPIIEKAVTDSAATGKNIRLAKMDVEQHPSISQQMGIQSIPAVVAFIDGKPADAFMGAKPEAEVRAFVEKVAASAPDAEPDNGMRDALDEADRLATEGDHGAAAELYSQILQHEPGNLDAFAGLGQCYIAVGEHDVAQKLIDKIPEEHRNEDALIALQKAIDLAAQADGLGDLSELAAKSEANPKDHQARFDYALALNAKGERDEAAEQLVAIVKVDRKWKDDGARTQLLEFFESWGNADAATMNGRRALSSVLFS